MKKLIIINGTMGVGKTTTCLELQKLIPKNVFLDGDWCWNMNPFVVNHETKTMVISNIVFLIDNFIKCNEYENIIFCWVMHEQNIIDEILEKLELENCKEFIFSLVCTEEALKQRLETDINSGKRSKDILIRSLPHLSKYQKINSVKIDVSEITPTKSAQKISNFINGIY
ncbi:MAG: AAA family ATPase [Clostridium sp.]|nr:AAA family ATPase [Clostridium sp.]